MVPSVSVLTGRGLTVFGVLNRYLKEAGGSVSPFQFCSKKNFSETLGTEDTFIFLTQVELDPYLSCHRNVRGLEEFLNKTNTGLL